MSDTPLTPDEARAALADSLADYFAASKPPVKDRREIVHQTLRLLLGTSFTHLAALLDPEAMLAEWRKQGRVRSHFTNSYDEVFRHGNTESEDIDGSGCNDGRCACWLWSVVPKEGSA